MEDVDLKDKIKVPEILAPAGSMESLKAAVAAGCVLYISVAADLVRGHMPTTPKKMKC